MRKNLLLVILILFLFPIEYYELVSMNAGFERQFRILKTCDSKQLSNDTYKTIFSGKNVILDRDKLVLYVMKHSKKDRMYRRLAEEIVDSACTTNDGKDCLLLLGLMERESNFYIFNKSSSGAKGLGQFMDRTVHSMVEEGVLTRPSDVFDPKKSIPAIIFWLEEKGLKKDRSNLDSVLFRYVGGNYKNKRTIKPARAYIQAIKKSMRNIVKTARKEETK